MTTRTVGDLTDDLRRRADLRGMTTRHPDADLRRELTQSLRALRAMITRSGGEFFITATAPAALPTAAPVTGEQHLEIDWPSGAIAIAGLDVRAGDLWVPLDPVSFASRRDYQGRAGRPQAFVVRTLPTETPDTTLTAGKIQIYPLDTQGLDHRVWYLPELPELSNTSHVINGFDGDWFEWVLWDATVKLCAEDDDVQNVDQIATRERAIVQERIVASVSRVVRDKPLSPRRHRAYR